MIHRQRRPDKPSTTHGVFDFRSVRGLIGVKQAKGLDTSYEPVSPSFGLRRGCSFVPIFTPVPPCTNSSCIPQCRYELNVVGLVICLSFSGVKPLRVGQIHLMASSGHSRRYLPQLASHG
jgi:hypothetical protein